MTHAGRQAIALVSSSGCTEWEPPCSTIAHLQQLGKRVCNSHHSVSEDVEAEKNESLVMATSCEAGSGASLGLQDLARATLVCSTSALVLMGCVLVISLWSADHRLDTVYILPHAQKCSAGNSRPANAPGPFLPLDSPPLLISPSTSRISPEQRKHPLL